MFGRGRFANRPYIRSPIRRISTHVFASSDKGVSFFRRDAVLYKIRTQRKKKLLDQALHDIDWEGMCIMLFGSWVRMRARFVPLLFCSVWLGLLLFGCEDGSKGRQCLKDGDCAYGVCSNGFCACPEPQRACGLRCVNLQEDAAHCGACDKSCPAQQSCQSGQCKPICPDEHTLCNESCAMLSQDPLHCGACGKICPEGQICAEGKCLCPLGLADCEGVCTDTFAHGKHCGACGQACPAGQVCSEGRCVGSCPEPTPTLCFGGCVDQNANALHCGQCGKRCKAGFLCEQGRCRCPEGQTECEGHCVDLRSSALHCGACGQRCEKGKRCGLGQCVLSCPEATPNTCYGGCVDTQQNALHCGACGTSCFPEGRCREKACRCAEGLQRCNNRCIDLSSDESHCGACGNACEASQRCQNGVCVLVCPPLQIACAGQCVSPQSDPLHCGTCGSACQGGQACQQGKCGGCPNAQTVCDNRCTDTQSDPKHCGACGNPCPNGQFCVGGKCGAACPSETPTACTGRCVDTTQDALHCGACGNTCKDKERCTQGRCEPICEVAQIACAGGCVDTQTNTQHCGSCGKSCTATERCVEGKCVEACPTGQTLCGNLCVNTQTNVLHCGRCEAACKSQERCEAGVCKVDCAVDGRLECGGICVHPRQDPAHCGACSKACPTNEACAGGSCVAACPAALPKRCDRACIDLTSDATHCGDCNKACQPLEYCNNSTCVCMTGLSRCGSQCANLQTDATNCGGCGLSCPSGQRCAKGQCVQQCPSDQPHRCLASCVDLQTDFFQCGTCGRSCVLGETCLQGQCVCGGTSTRCDGRCTETSSDRYHCGQCGRVCGVEEDCVQGTCKAICPTGEALCGKSCVNLLSDAGNCGRCGQLCKNDERCENGACRPKCNLGLTLCAGVCVGLKSNNAHCGACNTACLATEQCINGQCTALCTTGLTFCSGSCINPQTDNNHCGGCGLACTNNQTCTQGVCRPTCSGNLSLCGTQCVNLQTNTTHCGACGQGCAAGFLCAGGLCIPPCLSFETFCNGVCTNPETDNNHCGVCGKACSFTQACVQGRCLARPVVDTYAGVPAVRDGKRDYATFLEPYSIHADPTTQLYVADRAAQRIRKIDTNGRVSTIAGNGIRGLPGGYATPALNSPLTDPSAVYYDVIRQEVVFATQYSVLYNLTPNQFFSTELSYLGNTSGVTSINAMPQIANATPGFLFANPQKHRIQWVTSTFTTPIGTGTAGFQDGSNTQAQFNGPLGVVYDKTNNVAYASDTYNNAIRKIVGFGSATLTVSTFAGTRIPGYTNGTANQAQFNEPAAIVQNSKSELFVADRKNHCIRKITTNGDVSTYAGTCTQGYTDGPANQAQFDSPVGLTIDLLGNMYVADTGNQRIRRIDLQGLVTTVAGNGTGYGSDNGHRLLAKFNQPQGIAQDNAGNIYISDAGSRIRKIDANGNTTSFAGSSAGMSDGSNASAKFNQPQGLHVVDADQTLYIADSQNHRIRTINLQTNTTTTLAGGGTVGLINGTGTVARFHTPTAVTDYVSANVRFIAVSDTNNHAIRLVRRDSGAFGATTTFAGNGSAGFVNDLGTKAQFRFPRGLASQGSDLYVADAGNHCIRRISSAGLVITYTGVCGTSGNTNASLSFSLFNNPQDLAFDSAGNLFVLDAGNQLIRRITPQGSVTTVAGISGQNGFVDGLASQALFDLPTALFIDGNNHLYILDQNNHLIRRLRF